MKSKAIVITCCVGILFVSAKSLPASLPYFTQFSEEEGFLVGGYPDADGWIVRPETTLVATEHSVSAGQSVLLYQGSPPGVMRRGFNTGGHEVVFVDLFVRPAAGERVVDSATVGFDTTEVAFVQRDGDATVAVADLSTDRHREWLDVGYPIATDVLQRGEGWTRVTLRLDYGLELYDVYLDGTLAEHDLAFQPRGFGGERRLSVRGALGAESWVDDLYVGPDNPLFEDSGRTGIPEEWLERYGLDSDRASRYAGVDEDGRLAITEYFEETRPGYAKDEQRASVIERSNVRVPERRMRIFTQLEQPSEELQEQLKAESE